MPGKICSLTAGKKKLPDVDMMIDELFTRNEFTTCPENTSVLFAFFAQHFTHQFFKSDIKKGYQFTWGHHGVDVSNLYGNDVDTENKLRSFKDGKMKTQV